MNPPDKSSDLSPAAPTTPAATVWLVTGVLSVTDTELPAALHTLVDHADLCHPGLRTPNLSGLVLHGPLRIAWHVSMPTAKDLCWLDAPPVGPCRLLSLTVTPADGSPDPGATPTPSTGVRP